MSRRKLALLLFIAVSLADIICLIIQKEHLRLVSKPLVLITLALYYLASTNKISVRYIFALVFCFLGDVFLLFKGSTFFMLGLSAFLVGHVFFILILSHKIKRYEQSIILKAVIPFLFYYVLLLALLFTSLGSMLLPVAIYGFVISSLGVMSFYYYVSNKNKASLLFFIGVVVFIISDSLIAIDKFYHASYIFSPFIMISYIGAQYLICRALLKDEALT